MHWGIKSSSSSPTENKSTTIGETEEESKEGDSQEGEAIETELIDETIDYDNSGLIKLVQERQNEQGYDCGTPDGISGNKTKSAIRKVQEEKDVDTTGLIDKVLLQSLGITSKDISAITSSDN